jgi:proteasome lid subunit RPN8/RPN11
MLRLNDEIVQRIRTYGETSYPHECCGALLGHDTESGREILDLFPVMNRHSDSPRNRFVISPDDFRNAEHAAGDRSFELVGWYHSHPDHPALPSEFDRAHAWPWYSYIIVSVAQGRAGQMSSWRLEDGRARFAPERMEIAERTRV